MNNLKRVLSLGLTGAMLTGMMMVGASAADFVDADEIVNTEAVNTMVALNVINGKEDGSHFDPTATVTRAEMAKIITVMLNGGVAPTLGNSSKSTFTDVAANHWARGYIEYCVSKGIVAGRGNGTFGPEADVTGSEAAKMLLVALGYDSDVFGFTGIDWEINTNSTANDAKLYTELNTIDPTVGLTRDNAAQMAYNALDAKLMNKAYDKVLSNGEISYTYNLGSQSFLNKYFEADTFVGTFEGNKKSGATTVTGEVAITGNNTDDEAGTRVKPATLPADLDIADIGEEFKVIYKDAKGGVSGQPDKKDVIYGVFKTGTTTVYNITKADIQDVDTANSKVKFDGVKHDYVTTGNIMVNYDANRVTPMTGANMTALKVQDVDSVKFVCDENGKINAAYVTEIETGKITGTTAEKITINGLGTIKVADHDVYEDAAKGDIVNFIRLYASTAGDASVIVTKAETVEGELTGFKQDGTPATFKNIVVDGETYKVNVPAATPPALGTDNDQTSPTATNVGDTVRLYLVNGMVAGMETIETTANTYAMVTDKGGNTTSISSAIDPMKVTLLTSDGKEETLAIHKDSTSDGSTALTYTAVNAGDIIKYSMKDGKVLVDTVKAAAVIAGTSSSGKANVWDSKTKAMTFTGTTTAVAAADAVAYVEVTAGGKTNYYAFNLRDLGTIPNTTSGVSCQAFLNDDGLVAAAVIKLTAKPGSSSASTVYGQITKYIGTRKIGNETYRQYEVNVNEDEALVVNTPDTLTVGGLVHFEVTSDGVYNASAITTASVTNIAVENYDSAKKLLTYWTTTERADVNSAFIGKFGGTTTPGSLTVADDVVIRYVNFDDPAGATEEIGVNSFDATTGYANAAYMLNSDGNVKVIFVETAGKNMDASFATTAHETLSAPSVTGGAGTITYAVSLNKADGSDYNVGETVTVTVTVGGMTDGETADVVVTYGSALPAPHFTANGTKTVTFTVVAGTSTITAATTEA